jgi:hypothetical protein
MHLAATVDAVHILVPTQSVRPPIIHAPGFYDNVDQPLTISYLTIFADIVVTTTVFLDADENTCSKLVYFHQIELVAAQVIVCSAFYLLSASHPLVLTYLSFAVQSCLRFGPMHSMRSQNVFSLSYLLLHSRCLALRVYAFLHP